MMPFLKFSKQMRDLKKPMMKKIRENNWKKSLRPFGSLTFSFAVHSGALLFPSLFWLG